MDIALVVPSYATFTGNAASARRILTGLVREGHEGRIVDYETFGPYVPAILSAWEPAIVHAFHARRGAWPIRQHQPLVVSLTGTDTADDLARPDTRGEILEACRAARALVVHAAGAAAPVLALDPSLAPRVRVVPKGVDLPAGPAWSLRKTLSIPDGRTVFLLPAGLREVKGQIDAIEALDGLDVDLVLAGPELDPEYAARVRAAAAGRPWVRFIDIRPLSRMRGAYADADVVLNTSRHEGLSNAILEAMLSAKPVLASDIPANRAVVRPGSTGLLYTGHEGLRAAALRLRDDPGARALMGAAGAIRARAEHDPAAEIRALLEVYREAIESRPGSA
ncbi:MAG: glycosyltransferase family 4 protein [Candidatus Brocadiae bacterium]|nr:glycosyltransferase family 4 protein [Candidatus Brocadiia bacterium]